MKKVLDFIKKYRHYFFAFGIVVCLVAIDQITKQVVKNNVEYGAMPGVKIINNFFYITYSENFGAVNGSFDGYSVLLIVITIIALGVFIYLMRKVDFQNKKLYSWALCLIMAGTLGNFIDRIFNGGGVVDFLSVYVLGMGHDWPITRWSLDPWPTFNIADSLLVIGVISLAVQLVFFEKESEPKKDKNTPNVPEEELKKEESDGNN